MNQARISSFLLASDPTDTILGQFYVETCANATHPKPKMRVLEKRHKLWGFFLTKVFGTYPPPNGTCYQYTVTQHFRPLDSFVAKLRNHLALIRNELESHVHKQKALKRR